MASDGFLTAEQQKWLLADAEETGRNYSDPSITALFPQLDIADAHGRRNIYDQIMEKSKVKKMSFYSRLTLLCNAGIIAGKSRCCIFIN